MSLLKSIIYLTLLIIGIIGIIVFMIFCALNISKNWESVFGLVLIFPILVVLIIRTKTVIKDFIWKQTELTGIVDSKNSDEIERERGEDAWLSYLITWIRDGSSPWQKFEYYIKVNGISFKISRRIWDRLSEGDEVCVRYWPNTKRVTRINVTKKVDRDTARQIREKKREEALESFRKSMNERHKKP